MVFPTRLGVRTPFFASLMHRHTVLQNYKTLILVAMSNLVVVEDRAPDNFGYLWFVNTNRQTRIVLAGVQYISHQLLYISL